uniref:acetyl-CoA carboxylase carboxyltransferase beta subunit n=1 Tax=Juncus grisebachii TaxID=2919638 RepID=UPI001F1345C1|nr:acetyl-CoA carboxylase carboxyltransferase beta subunit [Juncus grisebachii]ULQ66868.1 acetyl-CoA carboxylase carboxyltransferase beta subunit [Juncus grisebachii]
MTTDENQMVAVFSPIRDVFSPFEHLWASCDNCETPIYKKYAKNNKYICQHCEFHIKMESLDRLDFLIDQGTWDPKDENMVSIDPYEILRNKKISNQQDEERKKAEESENNEKLEDLVELVSKNLTITIREDKDENEEDELEGDSQNEDYNKDGNANENEAEIKGENANENEWENKDVNANENERDNKDVNANENEGENKDENEEDELEGDSQNEDDSQEEEFSKNEISKEESSTEEFIKEEKEELLIKIYSLPAFLQEKILDLSKKLEEENLFSEDEDADIYNEKADKDANIYNEKADEANIDRNIYNEKAEEANRNPNIYNEKAEEANRNPNIYNEKAEEANIDPNIYNEKAEEANIDPNIYNEKTDEANRNPNIYNEKADEANIDPNIYNEKADEANIDPNIYNEKADEANIDPNIYNEKTDEANIDPNIYNEKADEANIDPNIYNEKADEADEDSDPEEDNEPDIPYLYKVDSNQRKTGLTDAVQTGIGELHHISLAIAVMDFEFIGGSMGSVVGEKITRLIEYATNKSLPLIISCASGGARMQEGSFSLLQMAKISSVLLDYQLTKNLFLVSILTTPTTGGVTASFGMLGNIIIGEPDAYIAFAGKRVIEEVMKIIVPEGVQEAEYLFEKGSLDLIIPRFLIKGVLHELLQFHGFVPKDQNESIL